MSATIHYRKTSTSDPYLKKVWAPSSFMEAMEKAFGKFPCEITPKDILVLKGMAAMITQENNPYEELIAIIEATGSVELYAKY